MASKVYRFFFVFMISHISLQRNIESSINHDPISAHIKKQIHKIMDEWFCSYIHNKAMIIVQIYTIAEFDELSKLLKEVIAEFCRCIQPFMMQMGKRL